MGNQQSGSLQFCSEAQLHTCRGAMTSYKSEFNMRVGYISEHISKEPRFQMQRFQNPHQHMPSQQQRQENLVEMTPLSPKCFVETQKQELVMQADPAGKKPTFNVYISCLDKDEEQSTRTMSSKTDGEAEIIDHFKDDLSIFMGVFGNVIINKEGLALYTDITGRKHCEEYNKVEIRKIFPMGISSGGLTKTIWFNDGETRDSCFDIMTTNQMLSSCKAVDARENKQVEEDDDSDNLMVFEGVNCRNVIVHAENLVLYTDIKGNKHCIKYNKHQILKCFPNGIHNGGLTKTIWFKDEMERDLCFMLMQWNLDEEEEEIAEKSSNQKFNGLCGSVFLNSDSQIEFTSLSGEVMKCFYEPSRIMESFPKGISHGKLPKTIWFKDTQERDRCIEAMRAM